MYKSPSSGSGAYSTPGQTNPWTQIPKGSPDTARGNLLRATLQEVYKPPHFVIINNSGTYAFLYNSSCSYGVSEADKSLYITGSVMGSNQGNLRLDVQPSAWRQTDAAGTLGDVTFVYKGGL